VAEDLKNKPAYKCAAYQKMELGWKIVRDVSGGTLHLRESKSEYLPVEPAEDFRDFSIRLSRAIFFNAFERTLHGLVGMVFRKEPKLGKDVPEIIRGREGRNDQEELGLLRQIAQIAMSFEWNPAQVQQADAGLWVRIVAFLTSLVALVGKYREWLNTKTEPSEKVEGWAENIDLQGNHWTVFAKEAFTDALRDGHSFIFVDMPPRLPDGATLADERATGRRPYWVSYKASQALNWRVAPEYRTITLQSSEQAQVPTGRQVLVQITFEECSYEDDGLYGEKAVKRYRVLRPDYWVLWKETKTETGVDYLIEATGEYSLKEIPVAVIYGRKTGNLTSRPSLLDLALINLAHFQKYSDYSEGLRMCIPQLCGAGVDPNDAFKVIGHHTFHVHRPDGKIYFAEPTGAGLEPQRKDLIDLQEQMAILGLSVMASKKPQPEKTATEVSIDHLQSDSELATAARSLKDAIELALKFTIQYQDPDATSGGSCELGTTFEDLTLSAQEMQVWSNMQMNGQLTLETFLSVLSRAGKLPDGIEPKDEAGRAREEAKAKSDSFLKDFERGGNTDV
jgi:hypothetical protein